MMTMMMNPSTMIGLAPNTDSCNYDIESSNSNNNINNNSDSGVTGCDSYDDDGGVGGDNIFFSDTTLGNELMYGTEAYFQTPFQSQSQPPPQLMQLQQQEQQQQPPLQRPHKSSSSSSHTHRKTTTTTTTTTVPTTTTTTTTTKQHRQHKQRQRQHQTQTQTQIIQQTQMQASSSYQPQFSPVIQLSYTADALQAPQPLQQQLQQQQVQVQPQPQPQQPQSQSDIILQGLWDELQRLMDGQSVLLKAPTPEGCKELAAAHASLAQRIAALYDDVTSLWAGTVLQPQDLPKARDTMQELAVVERQLTVLRTELEAITTAVTTTTTAGDPTQEGMRAMRPGMALAIQRQPFPQVFRKGEMLTESDYIVVKLIPSCLAMNCASVVSQVRAQVVSDPTPTSPMTSSSTSSSSSSSSSSLSPSPGGSCASGHNSPLSSSSTPMAATSLFTPTATLSSSPPGVTNGSGSGGSGGGKVPVTHELIQPVAVSLDPVTLTARFPLRFLDGTKNAPVALRFSLQMVVNGTTPVTVESELSAPFVVMTHKDQWKGAAGTMFKRESYFFANTEVPWALVANVLQAQFLRATKQAIPAEVHRPLSEFDLTYLSKRFFGGRAVVDQHQFDIFWEWFGTTMDTLRHQRPVLALWWQGLVYGFASKEDVEVALRNEAPGTFIIRFSETFPGSFAIAYATAEGVKHYHVTPQDHALHKTLPDFIVYHPQFKNVLQLQSSQDPTTGQSVLQLVRVDKNAAFESFCSKKTAQPRPIVPGYSLLM